MRRWLMLIASVLLIIDMVGLTMYYRPSSMADAAVDAVTGTAETASATVARSAAPAPAVDPVLATIENLNQITGGSSIETVGFTLNNDDQQAVREAVSAFTDAGYSAAFVLADLSTGAVLAYDGTEAKYSASSIKGPYVMSLAATGAIDLDGVMNGVTAAEASDKTYIENAIQISDNESYHALYREYGAQPLVDWMDGTGVQHNLTVGSDVAYLDLSAVDLALMWTKAYDYLFTDVDDAADGGKASVEAREWLASNYAATLNSSINLELGGQDRMMTKAGWICEDGYYALNDGGIVFPGTEGTSSYGGVAVTEKPAAYVITMLTDACGEYGLLENLAASLDQVYEGSMQS